jgi:hypothetical protein
MAEIAAIKHNGLSETMMPFVPPNPFSFPPLWSFPKQNHLQED